MFIFLFLLFFCLKFTEQLHKCTWQDGLLHHSVCHHHHSQFLSLSYNKPSLIKCQCQRSKAFPEDNTQERALNILLIRQLTLCRKSESLHPELRELRASFRHEEKFMSWWENCLQLLCLFLQAPLTRFKKKRILTVKFFIVSVINLFKWRMLDKWRMTFQSHGCLIHKGDVVSVCYCPLQVIQVSATVVQYLLLWSVCCGLPITHSHTAAVRVLNTHRRSVWWLSLTPGCQG